MSGTLLDSAWFSRLRLPALPDPVLLVVMVTGVRGGLINGTLVGGTAGYLRDLVTGSPLGVFTMGYLLVGITAGSLISVVHLDQPAAPAVAAAGTTALLHVTISTIVIATGVAGVQWPVLLQGLIVAAAANAVLARPVDTLLRWVDRVAYRRFPEKAIGYRVWR
ncbi:MAG: rod shape-determining protein MreD [bacterium]